MQKILKNLADTAAASNTCNKEILKDYIVKHAGSTEIIYKKDYPVALINENRKSDSNKATIRNVDIVALNSDTKNLNYAAKREQDFWKRLVSVDHIETMISLQSVPANECTDAFIEQSLQKNKTRQWSIETQLRDAMRANKENRELGAKPFIVLLCTAAVTCKQTDHIQLLLKHYFHENVLTFLSQNKKIKYYLAYNEQMSDIGMRYFYKFNN
ncbi:hypothetical protein LCX93_06120 [Sulfurimonas sp. SWIR-19]|uniref:hypothetical protein n=1 Tax=Sulfurimonas sp. SWIR-19 TaxID=2878390 RepID=UPI001CF37CD7|nr:hypothetical protein [Sulfurimonas sp. SWIR-19]UCN01491.1 hypothetical protein LCX93_06120 [Sulfurimonas sp. SWIR-19]